MFGLVGGWILAGSMLWHAALTITHATTPGRGGSLSTHRAGRPTTVPRLADSFDAMLGALEAHDAEQQRFAANASTELRTPLAITQTLLDVARNDPTATGELVERLRSVNAPSDRPHRSAGSCSAAPTSASFTRDALDLSLLAEEAVETLLPLVERHGVTVETAGNITPTIGSHVVLPQMTTNILHNDIVHNLPDHGTVQVHTAAGPESVMLTVETPATCSPQSWSRNHRTVQRGPNDISDDP